MLQASPGAGSVPVDPMSSTMTLPRAASATLSYGVEHGRVDGVDEARDVRYGAGRGGGAQDPISGAVDDAHGEVLDVAAREVEDGVPEDVELLARGRLGEEAHEPEKGEGVREGAEALQVRRDLGVEELQHGVELLQLVLHEGARGDIVVLEVAVEEARDGAQEQLAEVVVEEHQGHEGGVDGTGERL
ncbi:kinesin-like protein KIN-7H isoform X1 [Babesia caballi]|uniref:Kinesin-like protein KIN-7H isoform X1 n=1 Tax=Babesia caballi TaxID=5871 RepID=A0AAV4LS14_BABCB|nr:kinesin-like protein KIN-7H isoform X1 [Babesia caballi]